ncbi:MAG: metallopeptidase TldD-related protein, partial [Oliverpabstia sp.]
QEEAEVKQEEAEVKQEEAMRQVLADTDRKLLKCFGSLLHRELKLLRAEESREIVNYLGFSAATSRVFYNLQATISAEHNGIVYMRVEDTAQTLDSLDVDGLVSQIHDGIVRNMPSVVMKGGTMEAVLDARFVCNLFFMAWKLFSGPAYLQGQTATVGKLGKTILSKQISIEDRCESSGGGFQYALDCEGSPGRNVELVERGVFTGLMHNLQSAEAFGEKPTGNAGRKTTLSAAVQTEVSVTPKHLHILPGQVSLKQMIQSVDEGIWLTHCFDEFHSLDPASGDFSIPGEGIRIEKGELIGRVVDLSIEGNILQLLSGVLEVGRETCTMPLPDVRSFSVTAPAVHVSEIRISV